MMSCEFFVLMMTLNVAKTMLMFMLAAAVSLKCFTFRSSVTYFLADGSSRSERSFVCFLISVWRSELFGKRKALLSMSDRSQTVTQLSWCPLTLYIPCAPKGNSMSPPYSHLSVTCCGKAWENVMTHNQGYFGSPLRWRNHIQLSQRGKPLYKYQEESRSCLLID